MHWFLLGAVVLAQIGYPLTTDGVRANLVIATVVLGFTLSVWHAFATRGPRAGAALVGVTTGGGLLIEAIGVGTGFPFGPYAYATALGPTLLGVPVVVPLAWTWMAWPAWVVAGQLTKSATRQVLLAAIGLAAWDLFLDPQMVAEGYWHWIDPEPALPGVAGVPIGNYVGWFGVAAVLMVALAGLGGRALWRVDGVEKGPRDDRRADAPMLALYLWTYASSVLGHAVFLALPGSAWWGGLVMGAIAIPLAIRLALGARVSATRR